MRYKQIELYKLLYKLYGKKVAYKYLKNTVNAYKTKRFLQFDKILYSKNYANTLDFSFTFYNTCEGHNYWNKILEELKEYDRKRI